MMKKIIINIFIASLILLPVFALAQTGTPTPQPPTIGATIVNPLKCEGGNAADCNSLTSLLVRILNNIVMPIGAVLCVMWIIYAGFKYVTAQGNPKAISEAHQTLLWALVGTGILLGAAGISQVIQSTVKAVVTY